jgi:signal transduction histidine kinase
MRERAEPAPQTQRSRSVRFRLLAIALLPTIVILPLLLAVTIVRWSTKFDETLIAKVNGDLTIAHQYLARILEMTGEHIQSLSKSARFRDLVESGQPIETFLDWRRQERELDFLYIVDREGAIAARAPLEKGGPVRTDWPVIARAFAGSFPTAIDIYSNEDLAQISAGLAERARLDIVPTINAKPTDRTSETRGMVIHAAAPVTLKDGRQAVLVGGVLLNQNLVFIDTINDLVYREASLPEGSRGTATLFLDDVRISTNVRLFEGRRALGTRVSATVREAVLENGRTWLDRAFVVNDWYISAYEPIADSFGNRVGMLYVGFLEAPFAQTKSETLLTILAAFLGVTAVTIPIFLRWARSIFNPLESMTETIAAVERGDLTARTGISGASDEIGRVACHLDHLLDRLQERDRELRQWNEDLNRRVDERTAELQLANRELEATTKQLIMSEKLAAIGEITAGVAHEINNPIAVMQGNLEVIRSILRDHADPVKTEFRLLDEQIHRITQIVTKLLQFARPEEYAEYTEKHRPQDVVEDCMPLVQHLLHIGDIEIVRDHAATGQVIMNPTELQQVLVNLIVNAIHAMPDGGRLTVSTRDDTQGDRPGITIDVADTGIGMSKEVLERVFDPFFTTKRQQGNGLGLSISQRLVARQGGVITVQSAVGRGTTFSVWLPEAM